MIGQRRTIQSATRLVAGGAFLWLATALGAQTLRLDDLFTTPVVTIKETQPLSIGTMTSERATELLEKMDARLARGEHAAVLRDTEILLAWLSRESPEYGRSLWFRARAFEAAGESAKMFEVARIYLAGFPTGEEKSWFLVRMAAESMRQGRTAGAARTWQAIIEEGLTTTEEETLAGARIMIAAGNAESARRILRQVDSSHPDARVLLLESLMIFDDRTITVEASPDASARERLRHAALLELRGDRASALPIYEDLAKTITLSEEDRNFLQRRLDARAATAWPPG